MFTIGVAYKIKEDIVPPTDQDKPGDGDAVPPNDTDNSVDTDTDVDGDRSDKLPQTGGVINSASLIVLGAIAIGTGAMLNKKFEEKEGGKHNE